MSMCWNPFLLLPRELNLAICEELDLNDLKCMRLTCKTLENIVAPIVLSHIIISAKEATTIEEVISDLQCLTNPERAAVNCSIEITLSSTVPDSHIDEGKVDVAVVKTLSDEFFAALSSFKIVQTVNWRTGRNDPDWLQKIIWKTIKEFPDLRHLRMDSSFLKQRLGNFNSLKSLESINISGEPFKHNGALLLSLSKLYASSTNLNSITIKNSYNAGYVAHNLQQLFSSSPRGNPAHHLRHLALSSVPFCLDNVSLSHLTHLTSFELSCPSHVFNNLDDVWLAFKRSKIRLEELDVGFNAITNSLNVYLSSFSGLKKLKLSIPIFGSRASSEAFAVKFWSQGLPNHVTTINDFSLRASYGGQWCFGRHNRSLIEKCTQLEQLTISLLPDDIPTKAEDFNGIHALIDTVVTHMPHMEQLEMVVPYREVYRGDRCGTHSFRSRTRDGCRLADWVPKYQPPAQCQRIIVSCPGSRVFVVSRMLGVVDYDMKSTDSF